MKFAKYEIAFIVLTVREENIKRTAKPLQNRSIPSSCSMKNIHTLQKKVCNNKNNKRPRTAPQSQTMVQATQLEILPSIYSRLFHTQFERQHTKIRFAHRRNGFSFSSYTGCSNNTSSGIQPLPPLICNVIR